MKSVNFLNVPNRLHHIVNPKISTILNTIEYKNEAEMGHCVNMIFVDVFSIHFCL